MDEGKFWETNDKKILREQFAKDESLLNNFTDMLSELKHIPGETVESLGERIEILFKRKSLNKMKIHTTNYINTFIEVAEDCPATSGEIPPVKEGAKTVANIEFDSLKKNPYKYTSDDVLFQVFAEKNDLTKQEMPTAREQFFSKGQACFRASPLTKRYGWGIHCNEEGKIAMFGRETAGYQKFVKDKKVTKVKAMRSKR